MMAGNRSICMKIRLNSHYYAITIEHDIYDYVLYMSEIDK